MSSKFYNRNPLGILEKIDLRELKPGDVIIVQYPALAAYITLVEPDKGIGEMEVKIGLEKLSADMIEVKGTVLETRMVKNKQGEEKKGLVVEDLILKIGFKWTYSAPPGAKAIAISKFPIQALYLLSDQTPSGDSFKQ